MKKLMMVVAMCVAEAGLSAAEVPRFAGLGGDPAEVRVFWRFVKGGGEGIGGPGVPALPMGAAGRWLDGARRICRVANSFKSRLRFRRSFGKLYPIYG